MKKNGTGSGLLSISLLVTVLSCGAALAQGASMSQMERLLDKVDQPGSWPTPPPSNPAPRQYFRQQQAYPTNGYPINASPNAGFGGSPQGQGLFTPQNILRTMMGAPTGGTGSGGFAGARGNVRENLQTARDQAERAQSACGRASSGRDRELKMSAAEEARYAAQAAREAADRATSQAQNTTGDISDLAAQARNAADRAQAAADRATANAEGGGW